MKSKFILEYEVDSVVYCASGYYSDIKEERNGK